MLKWEENVIPKQTRKIRAVGVTCKSKKDRTIRDVIANKKKQKDEFLELAKSHFFYNNSFIFPKY
jgi:hypothetical protein